MKILLIIIALVIVIGFMAISYKNKFVVLQNRVKNAWSQIAVQLQTRFDLIPNLVETVKGYASHEKSIFEEVANARAKFMGAKTQGEQMEASKELNSVLSRLMAIVENYPQLKADSSFLNLQNQLADIENKIRISRQVYNDTATIYNQNIEMFPASIFAGIFNYKNADLFTSDEGAKTAPKVSF